MSDETRDASLGALESQLTSLTPQPSSLDRDYLLYHAGRASVRQGWFWQAATGFLVVVTAALSLALLYRPIQRSEPQVVERVVYTSREAAPRPASPSVDAPRATQGMLMQSAATDDRSTRADGLYVRDQVFRFGIDAMPSPHAPPKTEKSLALDPLLGLPASSLHDGSTRLMLRSSLQHVEN